MFHCSALLFTVLLVAAQCKEDVVFHTEGEITIALSTNPPTAINDVIADVDAVIDAAAKVDGRRIKRQATNSAEQRIVDHHNFLRKKEGASNMQFMYYNKVIAGRAKALADSCKFEHAERNVDGNLFGMPEVSLLGQNVYATTSPSKELEYEAAINSWYAEKQDYNHDTGLCTGVCGHYTQVSWANSMLVGCAARRCDTLQFSGAGDPWRDSWFFVCDYAPAGNIVDNGEKLKPFQKASYDYSKCSECSNGKHFCFEGLCRACDSDKIEQNCTCAAECQNCATVSCNCRCECQQGFTGLKCLEEDGQPKAECKPKTRFGKPPTDCLKSQMASYPTPNVLPIGVYPTLASSAVVANSVLIFLATSFLLIHM